MKLLYTEFKKGVKCEPEPIDRQVKQLKKTRGYPLAFLFKIAQFLIVQGVHQNRFACLSN